MEESCGHWIEDGVVYTVVRTVIKKDGKYYTTDKWVKTT